MFNMDFKQRVVIDTSKKTWEKSPSPGVLRKTLARENRESGHATSIVRYEAGAKFNSHNHPLGEEIYVISGVFSDETGDYPAGSYFRNPKGFVHAPFSINGCELLVKLHQISPLDNKRICIDTHLQEWLPGFGNLNVKPLHSFETENVALVFLPTGEHFFSHSPVNGEEIYVISGELIDELGRYPAGTWIRSPHSSDHQLYVEQDTLIWVKTGHLATN